MHVGGGGTLKINANCVSLSKSMEASDVTDKAGEMEGQGVWHPGGECHRESSSPSVMPGTKEGRMKDAHKLQIRDLGFLLIQSPHLPGSLPLRAPPPLWLGQEAGSEEGDIKSNASSFYFQEILGWENGKSGEKLED